MSAKTKESVLKAIAKHQSHKDLVRFWVNEGSKAELTTIAKSKGYKGLQPYIKHLLEQDTGLDL